MSAATGEQVPYAVAARELLRNTLLDAAGREMSSRAWSEITMSDIAGTAGVSRQTLYNEFGSRAEFAQELVLREAGRFIDAVQSAIAANAADPRLALQTTFELFLTVAAENPLVRAIVSGDGADELIALFTTRGETLVGTASARLTEVMLASWPVVAPEDAGLIGECLVRLAISYAALPKAGPAETAEAVGSLLGPYVEQLVAAAVAPVPGDGPVATA
ncbi:MAG TPA: TetR family transcriptional regulator [Solirubrobacteraceae bacterium]|jgi:AcrR family transcriptional regulator|nr:TetR family transcriptional regulator [Solirubrobacteraceae bacterium]